MIDAQDGSSHSLYRSGPLDRSEQSTAQQESIPKLGDGLVALGSGFAQSLCERASARRRAFLEKRRYHGAAAGFR
jgi:hypothetical protein